MHKRLFWNLIIFLLSACSPAKELVTNTDDFIHGYVAPGFEPVREVFKKNFICYDEIGASISVYYQGEKVVDLWGGYRDQKEKDLWEENDLVVMFSTTKGISALCLAVAHSKGWLNYDEKVSTYWPEFAQNGKENITVRQLLAHQAGLVFLDNPVKVDEMGNLDIVADKIAEQEPNWEPGTRQGYHTLTLGLYMNELLRRVDPEHRSIGDFLQEEIVQPLEGEFYIGLPDSVPSERLVRIKPFNPFKKEQKSVPRSIESENNFFHMRMMLKSTRSVKGAMRFKRSTLEVENPSGNGVGHARTVAKIYSEFATGGKTLRISPETLKQLNQPAVCAMNNCMDTVVGFDSYFSLGFFKPGPKLYFGSSRECFGTPGAGGSFGFADPNKQIGYCYAMSRMGLYPINDPREKSLREAVYRCIQELEK